MRLPDDAGAIGEDGVGAVDRFGEASLEDEHETVRGEMRFRAGVAVHGTAAPGCPAEELHVEGIAVKEKGAGVQACLPLPLGEELVS